MNLSTLAPYIDKNLDLQTIKQNLNLYTTILLEWNQTHNLTGAQSAQDIQKNIIDSLYPLCFLRDFELCLDVGSGAGFPAIALAIAKPKQEFILSEPRAKRAAFLLFVKQKLKLHNIHIEKKSIQEIHTKADLITSRAVMPTSKLLHLCSKNLTHNGYYLLYKGELSATLPNNLKSQIFKRDERIYLYIKGEI
ncbi:16S rRNA (guanine(527)-N(7))-methyltransferase RsmG [Helicobacter fennelliae]|uniref:Ribosomal RNA small subunit methyltransferase G n=1 Tax=Helicobacter fennelliae MRY12-0050 TaxID=1325130 RepID=T1DWZ4_9HELI|nr:16S rRNA (guanine(527)-N(7))-methyltransferase RsmG [Helicobacter fennelliae]GAD20063.1 rRNA small subunit 7-methylguanosine (m7G) methyltransferase GidB [Helicobacter fennelliae MRY12-0050]STP07776.1 glucose-inhibited division protein B [Helicobacter fennelliae]STQ84540.1 glucose-inhibited division protein B [Helicobacter fennelliae]